MNYRLYRLGVAWQNVAYNQPPHLGYYLPDADFSTTGIESIKVEDTKFKTGKYYTPAGVQILGTPFSKGLYIKDGKKVMVM